MQESRKLEKVKKLNEEADEAFAKLQVDMLVSLFRSSTSGVAQPTPGPSVGFCLHFIMKKVNEEADDVFSKLQMDMLVSLFSSSTSG